MFGSGVACSTRNNKFAPVKKEGYVHTGLRVSQGSFLVGTALRSQLRAEWNALCWSSWYHLPTPCSLQQLPASSLSRAQVKARIGEEILCDSYNDLGYAWTSLWLCCLGWGALNVGSFRLLVSGGFECGLLQATCFPIISVEMLTYFPPASQPSIMYLSPLSWNFLLRPKTTRFDMRGPTH